MASGRGSRASGRKNEAYYGDCSEALSREEEEDAVSRSKSKQKSKKKGKRSEVVDLRPEPGAPAHGDAAAGGLILKGRTLEAKEIAGLAALNEMFLSSFSSADVLLAYEWANFSVDLAANRLLGLAQQVQGSISSVSVSVEDGESSLAKAEGSATISEPQKYVSEPSVPSAALATDNEREKHGSLQTVRAEQDVSCRGGPFGMNNQDSWTTNAVDGEQQEAVDYWSQLPEILQLLIFERLTARERARMACVCKFLALSIQEIRNGVRVLVLPRGVPIRDLVGLVGAHKNLRRLSFRPCGESMTSFIPIFEAAAGLSIPMANYGHSYDANVKHPKSKTVISPSIASKESTALPWTYISNSLEVDHVGRVSLASGVYILRSLAEVDLHGCHQLDDVDIAALLAVHGKLEEVDLSSCNSVNNNTLHLLAAYRQFPPGFSGSSDGSADDSFDAYSVNEIVAIETSNSIDINSEEAREYNRKETDLRVVPSDEEWPQLGGGSSSFLGADVDSTAASLKLQEERQWSSLLAEGIQTNSSCSEQTRDISNHERDRWALLKGKCGIEETGVTPSNMIAMEPVVVDGASRAVPELVEQGEEWERGEASKIGSRQGPYLGEENEVSGSCLQETAPIGVCRELRDSTLETRGDSVEHADDICEPTSNLSREVEELGASFEDSDSIVHSEAPCHEAPSDLEGNPEGSGNEKSSCIPTGEGISGLTAEVEYIGSAEKVGRTPLLERRLNQLTELKASSSGVDCLEQETLHIERNAGIKIINLSGCAGVLDKGVQNLLRGTVEELIVSRCKSLGNSWLWLPQSSRLRVLVANELTSLKRVKLLMSNSSILEKASFASCSQLTSVTLQAPLLLSLNLAHCLNLSSLHLRCPNLKSLNLSHCNSLQVLDLKETACLSQLNLFLCSSLTPSAFSDIEKMTALEDLNLSGCLGVQQVDIAAPQLKKFVARGIAGLSRVVLRSHQLHEVDCCGCTSLSELRLQSALLRRLLLSNCTALNVLVIPWIALSGRLREEDRRLKALATRTVALGGSGLPSELQERLLRLFR